jgi:phospholipase/carboxylesterase
MRTSNGIDSHAISRRRFLALATAGPLSACATSGSGSRAGDPSHIAVRPQPPASRVPTGEHQLGLGERRDGVLYVSGELDANRPSPFAVMLHGAGGHGSRMRTILTTAGEFGITVMAPDSRGPTWDAIRGRFGPDVAFIGTALQSVFERVPVDPGRLAIGGFSDGATYALGLGLANGDLFTHILAFSPGFIPPVGRRHGKPRVFISHGTQDDVLPLEQTSNVIVPDLQQRGYDVRFREFGGGHTVPRDILRDAFEWFLR